MKEIQNDMNDDVLVKYLLGEATAAEQQEVQQWLNAGADNRRYFEHFKLIWEESKQLASKSIVDEQAAWERFTRRIQREEEAPQAKAKVIPFRPFAMVRAAAALIVLAGCGWLIYTLSGAGMVTISSGDAVLAQTLPDGSVVTLNRNSSIEYPSKFSGSKRPVTLKGEAFFNVTPDKSKPFVIDANNTSVTVVGTSFNVKSSQERTEVIVATGIVQVAKKQNAIKVLPHQKAIVSKNSDGPVMEENTDELYNYYRTKEFVCDRTPLWKLVNILNEAYDVQITIASERLRNVPLSVTFHEESLDNILKVISETLNTYNIQIEQKGKDIILK